MDENNFYYFYLRLFIFGEIFTYFVNILFFMDSLVIEPKKERLTFIDVMRGIAVLWMVETHVIDVVLANYFKAGSFYTLLNISNGMVAVSFLFCAGAGFWLASMKKLNDYRSFKKPLWVYLRRLGLILIIAYWLHFPALSLERFYKLTPESWVSFFQIDILQTIVYSSFLALIIVFLVPNFRILPYIFFILCLFFGFFAPVVLSWDSMAALPDYIGTLFARYPVSKFPLFPWSGYFFGGAALTAVFMSSENKKQLAIWLFSIFFVLMFVLFFTRDLTNYTDSFKEWWISNPAHFLFRLSCAIWVFSFLYLIEKSYKNTFLGKSLVLFGQESLFVYTFHLLVVYGSVANFGMKYLVGSRLDWFGSFLIIIALWIVCYALAFAWKSIKEKDMKLARLVIGSVFLLFIIIFILNLA